MACADREIAATSLHTFMRLPVVRRSRVILMDVLGYTLQEVGEVMDSSIPAERTRLEAYIDRFNARDLDAIRTILADDVRLDLVARFRADGPTEVGKYFDNCASVRDCTSYRGWSIVSRPRSCASPAIDRVLQCISSCWNGPATTSARFGISGTHAM